MIKVKVTQKDIDDGRRCHPKSCPIARALSRVFHKSETIAVYGNDLVLLTKEDEEIVINLPEKASGFISAFDRQAGKFAPFSFKLPIG